MIFNTLRMKLTMGFLPLLAIVIGLGLWAIVMFYGLGGNIDVVLRENYRSVLAAERMKEALERMDSGVMFAISGRNEMARTQFDKFKPEFERQLRVEQGNVTLPGEQQLVDDLAADFEVYKKLADQFFGLQPQTPEARADLYFSQLLPRFERIKGLADDILSAQPAEHGVNRPHGTTERGELDPPHDRGTPGGFRVLRSSRQGCSRA